MSHARGLRERGDASGEVAEIGLPQQRPGSEQRRLQPFDGAAAGLGESGAKHRRHEEGIRRDVLDEEIEEADCERQILLSLDVIAGAVDEARSGLLHGGRIALHVRRTTDFEAESSRRSLRAPVFLQRDAAVPDGVVDRARGFQWLRSGSRAAGN